jgi:DNA/RNA-binding protein KIN17
MRDENGFKMHVQSESHTRRAILIGETGVNKAINDYSKDFQRDFLTLLRTAHGEKMVHLNHFYQEYISHKEHIHMNATRWPSLTEFAKFLGREGICRVEEDEKGLFVSWIDNSPESLRRQDAVRKKERQDRGDEEREQQAIRAQILRAREEAGERADEEVDEEERVLKREEGEKITLGLSFGTKRKADSPPAAVTTEVLTTEDGKVEATDGDVKAEAAPAAPAAPAKVSMKIGLSGKPKNVFAAAKKSNAFGGKKQVSVFEEPKKMSEAERIMKEEIERRKNRGPSSFGGPAQKKHRF